MRRKLFTSFVLLSCCIAPLFAESQVVTYPAPNSEKMQTGYKVFANGKPVDVYKALSQEFTGGEYYFCYFDFEGPVEVKVPGSADVTVYLTVPFQVEAGAPLFVNYHGGGFIRGRDARYELFCRRLACTFRCVVVDVDYALAPDYPFPVAVEQAIASAKWAKEISSTRNGTCPPSAPVVTTPFTVRRKRRATGGSRHCLPRRSAWLPSLRH